MSNTPADAHYPLSVPDAHVIRTDAEAIEVAHKVAAFLLEGDAERDRQREVPAEVVDVFSNSGLWGITVPKEYGGAEVSFATLAEVIAIISAADASSGRSRRTITACSKTFVCKAQKNRRPGFWGWRSRATVLPMPFPKPAARPCKTSRRALSPKAMRW